MEPFAADGSLVSVSLIPGFGVEIDGRRHTLSLAPARLVAVLALQPGPMERSTVAGRLWPDVPESRAGSNLRTGLWRVNQLHDGIIVVDGHQLRLGDHVAVDYRRRQDLAHRVLGRPDLETLLPDDVPFRVGIQQLIQAFTSELLCSWYEEWLDVHQERWRQLRLHALDSISIQLTEDGWFAAAIDAATAAVAAEPLRESGYRSLMSAHLAVGNIAEAVRTHEQYRSILERELGVSPSLQMYDLLREATARPAPGGTPSSPLGRRPGGTDHLSGPSHPTAPSQPGT